MKYQYESGATRWFRYDGQGDVRSYRSPKGWYASAEIRDTNPITGRPLRAAQWWIREEYEGDEA